MANIGTSWRVRAIASGLAIVLLGGVSRGDVSPVRAEIALSSLIALSDGHLQKVADSLTLLAMTDVARSADWGRIRGPLREAAKRNVDATMWFALRDGSYWTVEQGRSAQTLAHRPYFLRVMAGKTILGELVVSKSTGKSVAVIAVPIRGSDGTVVGALGASVPLDQLSARITREMSLDETTIFYAFDANLVIALDWDPSLIFAEAPALSKEVGEALRQMRARREGVSSYSYRGKHRTVVFRRSDVTGWWYVFGVIPGGREQPGSPTGG